MQTFINSRDFEALQQDDHLPSPSGVRLSIMRMCGQDDVSLIDLVIQIQSDPLLGGRIIKIGNGAAINKGRPIVAVSKDVLQMIGLQSVRQLTLAISLTAQSQNHPCAGFDYRHFWARTVAMACAGQALAEYYGEAPPSEMFSTGLLANVGQLGLSATKPLVYAALLARGGDRDALRAGEKEVFGYNQCELAAAMMQDWDIPMLFCHAVLHHTAPAESGLEPDSRAMRLTQMLALAGAIADYCVADESEQLSMLQIVLDGVKVFRGEPAHVIALCDRVGRDCIEWAELIKIEMPKLRDTGELMQQLQQQQQAA